MKYQIQYEMELRKNPYKGRYIAIEGVDASGKTTQVEEVKNYLEKEGHEVIVVSEPSDKGPTGKLIRDILAGREDIPLAAFQFIYTADRIIQFERDIIPALQNGKIVLSSRCFWSAIPYGVMDKGESEYRDEDTNLLMMAQGILSMYHQFVAPDKTVYLKISADTACDRLSDMDKVKEIYEKKSKLEKLVKGYDWLSRKFSEEIITVNGENSIENVTRDILKVINL